MKVYGPYSRKDGRKHVIIVNDDGSKTTKSYPRLLMEQHLGRELLPTETVDHIDEDKTNDDLSNLQILLLEENVRKSMKRRAAEMYKFLCPQCGTESSKTMRQVKGNLKKNKEGPYCSRSCAGKATYKNPWIKG